ncbi:MAG TPA: 3-deoxy-D-manno-octulosonic acid transferase [Candidatus Saccharimonadales bacterium]|jgi:3-deoxy-D-manno-octulosonic-acid transferase|nr:3-deoxy-D-manno-octulosonic acid transferase [Candidatus Saccharimonadales bacterium]
MYAIYSLLTAAGMLLLSPYFLLRGLIQKKYLSNLPERFGRKFSPELVGASAPDSKKKSIWIHAVSVGEVLAVLPLAQRLKKKYPQRRLVISTTTLTGQKLARERMQFADATFFFPLDWRGPVRRVIAAANPAAVIIVETEIWPNFLRECRRGNVPVAFVNGRLSERSFRGFKRALSLSAGMLSGFLEQVLGDAALYLMQSGDDAGRLIALGAPADRVTVTGNLKYDLAEPDASPLSAWLEAEVASSDRRPVIVAGSVLANEEARVLEAFAKVEGEFPRALLILAPRKPEQFDHAAVIVADSGHKLLRRSDLSLNGAGSSALAESRNVLLLDSIGELAGLYRVADAVFVGGSLVRSGGHNILEPAAFGKAPVYGPSMENFREMAAKFLAAGAAIQVNNPEELGAAWRSLLKDAECAKRMGASARNLVDQNRGATERVLEQLEGVLGPARSEM